MSLKIIHFSDLHMIDSAKDNPVCNRIDSIVAACQSNLMPDDNVLIVFSGDIAYSGKKSEYKIFSDFLSEITRKIKNYISVKIDIICVPGNHDCCFGSENDINKRKEAVANAVKLGESISNSDIIALTEVQKDYKNFIANIPTKYTEFNDLVWSYKSEYGINDGTVSEPSHEILDENEPSDNEKKIASLYESFKVITVLGQIIKCYPAEIDGDKKIEIIKEIHNVAMRTANAWISIFEIFEDDFIEHEVQRVKSNNPNFSNADIAEKIKTIYGLILAEFVIAMIFMTSQSLGGETSRRAAEAALGDSISGQIALFNMELTCKDPPISKLIDFYKKMQSEKKTFACTTLRHLVANYLRLNKCGKSERDRLCEVFKLEKIVIMLNKK